MLSDLNNQPPTPNPQPLIPFTAHRLHVEFVARDPIVLGQHTGSALRGMFYRALMALTGPVRYANGDAEQIEFMPNEPVRYLLASLDEDNARGKDIPRPYTIEPIVNSPTYGGDKEAAEVTYLPGQRVCFSLTLYARAMELFPYVILALKRGEEMGIGRGRGRFIVSQVWCSNPFTGQQQAVFAAGDALVRVPDLPITHEQIMAAPAPDGHTLVLDFRTPTTLRARKQPVITPEFSVILHRLIERLAELSEHFASAPLPCLPATREDRNALLRQADAVRLVHDGTHWVALNGYSARQHAPTALSGFVGTAAYETGTGGFAPFMPLLRWGEVVHAGKHAVKGNGLYQIVSC